MNIPGLNEIVPKALDCFSSVVFQPQEQSQVSHIGLSGGVFQNRVLSEQAVALLEKHGFAVNLAEVVPCNDAAICFGQIIEYGALQNAESI